MGFGAFKHCVFVCGKQGNDGRERNTKVLPLLAFGPLWAGPLWTGPSWAGPLWVMPLWAGPLGSYGPGPHGPVSHGSGPHGPHWALMGRTLLCLPGPLLAKPLWASLSLYGLCPYGPGPYGLGPHGPLGHFALFPLARWSKAINVSSTHTVYTDIHVAVSILLQRRET